MRILKLHIEKIRYLMAGGWNMAFGYGIGVALFYSLSPRLHTVVIGVLANILAITMSFTTYKLFVFKTKGNWLSEYFRSCMVYAGMALLGVVLLWLMVDHLGIKIWLAQGLVIASTVVISYIGHARFTFKKKTTVPEKM